MEEPSKAQKENAGEATATEQEKKTGASLETEQNKTADVAAEKIEQEKISTKIGFPSLEKYWFSIGLNILLILLMLIFGAGPLSIVPYLLVVFIPGYFIAALFTQSDFLRSLFAFPFSLFVTSLPIYIFGLFGIQTVNILSLVLICVICGALLFVFKSKERITIKEPEKYFKIALLCLVAIVFVEHTMFIAGSFNREIPYATALDQSVQLSEIDWLAKSGTIEMAPWLHNNESGVYSNNSPIIATIAPSFFEQIGGLSAYNAQNLFQTIVFVMIILGVFIAVAAFFDQFYGIASALFITFPPMQYFFANVAGMTRIHLGVAFFAFAILAFYVLWQNKKCTGLFFSLILAGLLLAHTPIAIGLLVPFVFTVIFFLLSKEKKTYLINAAIAIIILIPTLSFLIPAFSEYGTDKLRTFELISIEKSDEFFRTQIGPVLMSSDVLHFNLAAIIAVIILVCCYAYIHRKDLKGAIINKKTAFLITALFMAILTLCLNNLLLEYAGKMRYTFLALFFAPPVLMILPFFIGKTTKYKEQIFKAVAVILVLLFISGNFATNFTYTEYIPNKFDDENWQVLKFIKQQPEDKTFFAFFDFFQWTHFLTNHKSAYVSQLNLSDPQKIMDYEIGVFCRPGFKLEGLSMKNAVCPDTKMKIQEFDYIELNYKLTEVSEITKILEEKLKAAGYTLEFQTKTRKVYKKL